ncbi:hypothetical protein ARMSODRAFT_983287 [Armillaria solidipes]|uniref:Uncharacterized protein n=1 Tax=Armillaria solidipes TaxID=1076256 RepID=A0A2H3B7V9_9AGAR|nr:hypothetical protein ARMSODRAFT_983287 [Armillaria solidipes]
MQYGYDSQACVTCYAPSFSLQVQTLHLQVHRVPVHVEDLNLFPDSQLVLSVVGIDHMYERIAAVYYGEHHFTSRYVNRQRDKVVSDADGQTICTTLKDFFPKVLSALDCLISAKGSFATAGVPDSAVCSITNSLNGDNSKFMGRLDAACPDSAKGCAQDLTDQIVAKAAEVKKAYDC